MAKKNIKPMAGQGSLFGETTDETEQITSEIPLPEEAVTETEIVAATSVKERSKQLNSALGFLANLSRTSQYETIDDNPWFQEKISRQHPHDYQQHLDEVLASRERFIGLSRNAFAKAFGRQAMIEAGLLSEAEADKLIDDLYNGWNKSGENDASENFAGTYADPKNNKNRLAFRKKLEKQNPSLKKPKK